MYTFSDKTVAEFYGIQFYSILDGNGKIVAYSQKVFEIPYEVMLIGESTTLIFEKAIIRGGVICGGEIRGGVIWGGEIRGGEICGGVIWGGVICGGEIWGGVICGGVICGGVIRGGVIRGGVIWGGEICGGEIRGGVIRGGVIWGGEICGGEIKVTFLQIQGSRHFCYGTPNPESGTIELGIGCHIHPIQYWLDSYSQIGKQNGYSESEIAEYGEYIQIYAKRYLK